ncbi:MAG: hypothetical protein Kow0022_04560 [Phycisphaerales bacterium]
MTREHKLALIVGFSLVLVVGILISDHLSPASLDEPLETLSFNLPLAEPEPFVVPSTRLREADSEPPAQSETAPPALASAQEPIALPSAETPKSVMSFPTGPVEIVQGSGQSAGSAMTADTSGSPVPGFVPVGPERSVRVQVTESAAVYAKYVVQEGDTVAGIARRFLGSDSRWPEIQALNPDRVGKDGSVRAGVTLKMPASSSGGGRLLNTQGSAPARTGAADAGSRRIYVVKANDTLSQIAQRELGTSKRMEEILRLNKDKIRNPDEIYEGLKLVLPSN